MKIYSVNFKILIAIQGKNKCQDQLSKNLQK